MGAPAPAALAKAYYKDAVNDTAIRLATDPGGLYVPPASGPFSMSAWTWDRQGATRYPWNYENASTAVQFGVTHAGRYVQLHIRDGASLKVNTAVDFGVTRVGEWVKWLAVRDAADLWKVYARALGDVAWVSSTDGGDTYTGMSAGIDRLSVGVGSNWNGSNGAMVAVERDLWASGEEAAWFTDPQAVPVLGADDGIRYLCESGYPQLLDDGPNANHMTLAGATEETAFYAGYPPTDAGGP